MANRESQTTVNYEVKEIAQEQGNIQDIYKNQNQDTEEAEIEKEPKPKYTEPEEAEVVESTSTSDGKCPSSVQIGLSSIKKCKSTNKVTGATMTINPKADIQLKTITVFATDVGNLKLTLTGTDGTNESLEAYINPGKSQIILSELYAYLKKGEKYTLKAMALSIRDGIVPKLESSNSCAGKSYRNNNISIKFNDNVAFYNIRYCLN